MYNSEHYRAEHTTRGDKHTGAASPGTLNVTVFLLLYTLFLLIELFIFSPSLTLLNLAVLGLLALGLAKLNSLYFTSSSSPL